MFFSLRLNFQHKAALSQLTCLPLWFILLHPILGTCEASRFNSNSNRTSRFDLIRKWRADSKISNRRTCHVCRCTINNTHCSTTNFNPVSIATGIYIELQPCMQYGSLVRLQSNKTPMAINKNLTLKLQTTIRRFDSRSDSNRNFRFAVPNNFLTFLKCKQYSSDLQDCAIIVRVYFYLTVVVVFFMVWWVLMHYSCRFISYLYCCITTGGQTTTFSTQRCWEI